MASVVIKNLPDDLHRALKRRAQWHHRSLNQELLSIIESAMNEPVRASLPDPVRLRKPLTAKMMDVARRGGRV